MDSSHYRNGAADLDRTTVDYEAVQDPGEGHSPAGWTGTIIMLLGSCAGCVFNLIGNWTGFWVSAAVVILGLLVGVIMSKAGLGAKTYPHHHTLPH